MDIGGGSTEFIAGQDGKILRSGSALLGCVSSLERCVQEDPPTGGEIDTLRAYIRERAVPLCRQVLEDRSPSAITGIGGTATQLAMILTGAEFYTPELINGMRISRDQLEELMQRLISMDLKTRKALPGMDPNRADVIVSGGLITLEMLLAAGCKTLVVCDDDGLDGYLFVSGGGKRLNRMEEGRCFVPFFTGKKWLTSQRLSGIINFASRGRAVW